HIMDDELVMADLIDHNPNVFYELAVRHALRKPIVQLIEKNQTPPFDVSTTRTLRVNWRDLDGLERQQQKLKSQMEAALTNPAEADNPISVTIDIAAMASSNEPVQKTLGKILSRLENIQSVNSLLAGPDVDLGSLQGVFDKLSGYLNSLEIQVDSLSLSDKDSKTQYAEEAKRIIVAARRQIHTASVELKKELDDAYAEEMAMSIAYDIYRGK
ncbi:MAG: hypothetical protein MUO18_02820, partial [Methanomassiliicoccales archaeon]|nr:hypothetical protein [Methanomassiliicoccales archaeon]